MCDGKVVAHRTKISDESWVASNAAGLDHSQSDFTVRCSESGSALYTFYLGVAFSISAWPASCCCTELSERPAVALNFTYQCTTTVIIIRLHAANLKIYLDICD